LSDPGVNFCPLRRDLYGIEEESRKSVERVLRSHIEEMGMHGPARVLEMEEQPVSFGASEILGRFSSCIPPTGYLRPASIPP
jgi:hypothetical protein